MRLDNDHDDDGDDDDDDSNDVTELTGEPRTKSYVHVSWRIVIIKRVTILT